MSLTERRREMKRRRQRRRKRLRQRQRVLNVPPIPDAAKAGDSRFVAPAEQSGQEGSPDGGP